MSSQRQAEGMQEIRKALDVYEAQMSKKETELAKKEEQLNTLVKERKEEEERVKQTKVFEKVITLNVGGTQYTTTLSTLTKYPDSMLGAMFSGRHDLPQQEDGSYFIDRDGETFQYILMFLRDRNLCLSLFPTFSAATLLQLKATFEYFQICPDVPNIIEACRIPNPLHFDMRTNQPQSGRSCHSVMAPTIVQLEYSRLQINCSSCAQTDLKERNRRCCGNYIGVLFPAAIELTNCNLSGACFMKCSFQGSTSFEGCILLDTVFNQVHGLVSKRVHFTPWQVAQASFEPQLLEALQEAGCIYD